MKRQAIDVEKIFAKHICDKTPIHSEFVKKFTIKVVCFLFTKKRTIFKEMGKILKKITSPNKRHRW